MGKCAGAAAPLLPGYELVEPSAGSASVSGAVFNLSTCIVGAGMMSIPATVMVLGVAPAAALIVGVALLCDLSVEFLLRYTESGKGVSYGAIMGESFGRAGAVVVQACTVLNNLGILITYLIIIGDVFSGNQSQGSAHPGLLPDWFGSHWWNSRPAALLIILVLILLPLLLLTRLDSLRFSSAVSVFLAVVFVAASSAMALHALLNGATKTPRLFPDRGTSFFELFTAVPVVVLAFTFHFNVHPICAELRRSADMTKAVRLSLVFCAAIYAAVGLSGYLLFGDATMANIISNFDRASASGISPLVNDLIRLSYGLHLVLVFPLLNFSLRINMDGLFFPRSPPLPYDQARFVSLTVGLAASVYLAAIAIPNIWTLFQFFGSTSSICLSFVFHASIVLRDVHRIALRREKVMAVMMIGLAVTASAMAVSSNLIGFVRSRK